jgi:hypothetical protein
MVDRIRKMGPRKIGDSGMSTRRKAVLVGCGVLVACATLALGIVLASGGGGSKASGIKAQAQTTTAQAQSTTPSAASTETSGLEKVEVPPLSIYGRRNPFKPLVNMEQQTSPTTPTTPTTPGTGVVTVPEGLVSGGNTAGEVISREITLEGVFEENGNLYARLRVADKVFDRLAAGDTFAGNFKLLALGKDSGATILYGDERLTVYTGQSIYW